MRSPIRSIRGPVIRTRRGRVELGDGAEIDLDRLTEEQVVGWKSGIRSPDPVPPASPEIRDELDRLPTSCTGGALPFGRPPASWTPRPGPRPDPRGGHLSIAPIAPRHGDVVDPGAPLLGSLSISAADPVLGVPRRRAGRAGPAPRRRRSRREHASGARRRRPQLSVHAPQQADTSEQQEREERVQADHGPRGELVRGISLDNTHQAVELSATDARCHELLDAHVAQSPTGSRNG